MRFELLKIDYFPVFRVLEFNFQTAALSAAVKRVLIFELEAESGPAKNQDESRFDFGEANKKTKA